MTLHTHNRQQPAWTAGANTDREAPAPASHSAQPSLSAAHQDEQASLAVMHPDHHDPDWRYYFGAMAMTG